MTKYTHAVNIVETNGQTIEILKELKDNNLEWTTNEQSVDGVKLVLWCGVKLKQKRQKGDTTVFVNRTHEFIIEQLAKAFAKTLNGNPLIENTIAHLNCEMQAVRLEAAEEMKMFLNTDGCP